jgi:site-specific DNA-adenine methylase
MVYQGSKTKYAKDIVPILQKYIDDNNIIIFIDGMCGGCNIIDKIKCEKKIALDLNPYLIDLYNEAVYNNLEFPKIITREDWDSCKNHPELNPKWKVALVAFFTSYSARGFVGGYAMNGDRDYYNERLNNFKKQLPNLQGIEFKCLDIYDLNVKDTLIYLDPPYKNTKKYDISKNFNSDSFWNKVRDLSKDNIVIVSEQEAPDDFEIIWSKDTQRNCFGSEVKKATETLFKLK